MKSVHFDRRNRISRGVGWLVAFAAFIGACSSAGSPGLSGELRSQALLAEPPPVNDFSGAGFAVPWVLAGEAATVEFIVAGGSKIPLEVQGQQLVMLVYPSVDSDGTITHYLVGSIDANDTWSLFRFHDSTGDGVPDSSTQTLLFDTGTEPAYITHMVADRNGADYYLLDRLCQDSGPRAAARAQARRRRRLPGGRDPGAAA